MSSLLHDFECLIEFYAPKSFENRGIFNVIASTVIVTTLLCTFLFVNLWYTTSFLTLEGSPSDALKEIKLSSWKTSYDLPDVPLLELHTSTLPGSDLVDLCPDGNFALVLYLESPISTFAPWMEKCGSFVTYFRVNGNPEIEDIEKIIKFVPNAQYIPIKAELRIAKDDDLLGDPEFQKVMEIDEKVVNSLAISGYMNPKMLRDVLKIAPFIEELTLEGTEICGSLVRPLGKFQKETCEVDWTELRKLKIVGVQGCFRTFDFIDMCWEMQNIYSLEVSGSHIDEATVRYIEDIIDRYRITKVHFEDNLCSAEIRKSHEYICGMSEPSSVSA
jgi:hypothetical protein